MGVALKVVEFMSEAAGKKKSNGLPLGIIAVAVLAAGVGYVLWSKDNGEPNEAGELTAETALEIFALKDSGLAKMENASYAESAQDFEKLLELSPKQPLAVRNRAIAWVLATDISNIDRLRDRDKYVEYLKHAQSSISDFLEQESNSPLAHYLAGRFAYHFSLNDAPKGFTGVWVEEQELELAATGAQSEAAFWCEVYNHYSIASQNTNGKSADQRLQAKSAIEKAYQLQPTNLYASIELMLQLASLKELEQKGLQPAIQDDYKQQLLDVLDGLEPLLKPFFASILRFNRQDLKKYIDAARDAVKKEDWKLALRNCRFSSNLVRPQVAYQIDLRRIKKHLLEFIEHDFAPSFESKLNVVVGDASPESGIDVSFKLVAQVADLKDVKQVRLADFDLDQSIDVIVAHGNKVQIFSHVGETWDFTYEFDLPGEVTGIVVNDLDLDDKETPKGIGYFEGQKEIPEGTDTSKITRCADADIDLIAYGDFGAVVIGNKLDAESGKRTLEAMPQDEEFAQLKNIRKMIATDIDHDADLDLIVTTDQGISIWSNRDDFTFYEVTSNSSLPESESDYTNLLAVDWNRNVDVDVVMTGPEVEQPVVLENAAHGRFRAFKLPDDFTALANANDVALKDVDANATWDFIVASDSGVSAVLTSNPDAGVSSFLKSQQLDQNNANGVTLVDYDNDGLQDVFVWDDDAIRVLRQTKLGTYQAVPDVFTDEVSSVLDIESFDFDGDGDLDLVASTPTGFQLFANEGGNQNNWLSLVIRGDPDRSEQRKSERVNIHGVGSLVELKTGTSYQPRLVTGQVTHFGLGKKTKVDIVRILWTNGIPQNLLAPTSGIPICHQQVLGGSCPYIYTWDGEKYTFFSDCLWAAPIGLQFAEGVSATPREWEYLKIPGERLAVTNGEYRLQLTEELWEAAYFDSVELIAVDHPEGVEIFSNEKVGPPSVAEFKIHTVRNPRKPVAARDQHGRDILPQLSERDELYLKAFDENFKQGLTNEHYIELDLGKLESVERLTLFLTGWIFPTNTSINVSLSQNPSLPSTKPPSVWVPNKDGEFVEVIPYMGFPGGKTKTIAVDLSDAFLTDDYRVRIVTSMEIYWNAAFFSLNEEPVEMKQTTLPLTSGNAFYRGFSKRLPHPQFGPENYDHNSISMDMKWPPMQGYFTRFGDVTELMQVKDDCSVVLGAGDAIDVTFKADDGPPKGWKRDFILHCTGWDKDADLNTLFGQTVEPLPFRAMRGYPDSEGAAFPTTPKHQDYRLEFQTRQQPRAKFWTAIRNYVKP